MNTYREETSLLSSDQEFITQLYYKFNRLMFFTANKYTSDLHQSEEIVQECLKNLIEKTSTLKTLSSEALACYVVTATKNTAINCLKRSAKAQEKIITLSETDFEKIHDSAPTLDEIIITKAEIEHIKTIWPTLDAESRYLLEGKYILGYDNTTLSNGLNCQPNSVRMKLTRARRKLIQLLKEDTHIEKS